MTVGILGLGLIGGSLAKALSARTDHRILGADKDPSVLSAARLSGAISGDLTDERLTECDLLLLALPPAPLISEAQRVFPLMRPGAVAVDCCGVKRAVVGALSPLAKAAGVRYVGGHPMAGKERGGFENAGADLFSGASMILTPTKAEEDLLPSLKALFLSAGFAAVRVSDPEEHDRLIALTSQLAHVVSGAYVKSPTARSHAGFSAGSFQDMTRVALLDEAMWCDLMMLNRDHLSAELALLIRHLNDYQEALDAGDAPRLSALLKEGRARKQALLSERSDRP